MASSSSSPTTSGCRRKKKTAREPQTNNNNSNPPLIQWNSHAQHHLYSSKLLRSLRHLRLNPTASSTPSMPMRVRNAANRVLAATARGRWHWSRALLKNRLKFNKIIKNTNASKRRRRQHRLLDHKKSKLSVPRLKSIGLGGVERRARELGRLVPGCRKQPLHVVLEEAAEYIPALQMQVRAMSALAELLSNSSA